MCFNQFCFQFSLVALFYVTILIIFVCVFNEEIMAINVKGSPQVLSFNYTKLLDKNN